MRVDYRGSLSTVYNDGGILTHGQRLGINVIQFFLSDSLLCKVVA